jgi:hypothetical protein
MPAERVLHFVGDRRGHLAERRQAIAEPLALLELLDARQVLEEEGGADVAPRVVLHVRQRVADHLAGVLEAHFGAVGQVRQVEGARDHTQHVRGVLEHFAEVPADVRWRAASGRGSGRRCRSSPATRPSA